MLTAADLRRHPAVGHPAWMLAVGTAFEWQQRMTGTEVVVEGWDRLSRGPVLLATNASHKYDFFPLRAWLRRRGVPVVSLAKGKYFQQRAMAWAFARVGVLPLISRGYVLAADFVAVHGRRPGEDEYRALRDHVDHGAPLPDGEPFAMLSSRARTIVGVPFDPRVEGFRAAVLRTYAACMRDTMGLARAAVSRGHHIHVYPEGTVSSRLGRGRRGAVQLAHALGLPIQPIGISGCREAFRAPGSARLRGGRIVIRIGEPWHGATAALPGRFLPFDPVHERDCAPLLDEATTGLMARIDALLDPAYRHAPHHVHDGSTGVGRFL